ncbi:unnamed protein product [Rotaria magnacalcarata]
MEGPSAPQDTIPGSPQDTTPLSNAADTPSKFLGEQDAVRSCVNRDHLLTMKDLTEAGELMYTTDTLKTISEKLIADFNATEPKQFSKLMKDCLIPMMYLLKRELNLLDFTKFIKQGLMTNRSIPRSSQRMLVDILLKNSEHILARTLVKRLSKRNPLPFFQVSGDSQQLLPYVIHVWDYTKPTILSFGIGPCPGKSSLINSLFLSNFEQSVSSSYFQGTIDIDFGYSFVQARPINIADAHGSMSFDLLGKVNRLFDGFIIHVNTKFLFDNFDLVKQFLASLPNDVYRYLLIRDSTFDENETILGQLPVDDKLFLCQVIDKKAVDSEKFVNLVLEKIYRSDTFLIQRRSENDLGSQFQTLFSPECLTKLNAEKQLVDSIKPTLIIGNQNHFPLYNIFAQMCKKRIELSELNFYGSQDKNTMFTTQAALGELEMKLRAHDSNQADCGKAFKTFFNLMNNDSRLINLNILASTLKQELDNVLMNGSHTGDWPYEHRLSMEVHWRNAIVCYDHMSSNEEKEKLVQYYHEMIATGQSFEIIDGDNFYCQSKFLETAMSKMHGKRVLVISVIGPQSSGKSTLLNYMFGTSFDVRDGRCTRGKQYSLYYYYHNF